MGMFSGGNVAMNESKFEQILETTHGQERQSSNLMTAGGAATKAGLLLFIVIAAAIITWRMTTAMLPAPGSGAPADLSGIYPWMIGGVIGGLVLALIIVFVPKSAPFLSPIYAAAQGLFLGAISAIFEAQFPGIVVAAAGSTMAVLLGMLALYKLRIIVVTRKFVAVVMAATAGVFLFYAFAFVSSWLGFMGAYSVLNGSGPLAIGISIVIIIIAALNLVLDFHLIEHGEKMGLPKYMEWYAAFGLLVTLIWLYLEFLRLYAKLQNR